MSDFRIKTEEFEGPLDLLLTLIEKRKFLINDISLSKVTDDYISYINSLPKISLRKTSEFVLTASTLLLIKSKSLLPTIQLTQEEEESIEDLEIRLKIYKRLQEASVHTKDAFGKNISFKGAGYSVDDPIFVSDKNIQKETLKNLAFGVINLLPKKEKLKQITVSKVISLEEMIIRLTERIKTGLQMSFKEFSNSKGSVPKEEKVNVIISFLAMLELVKQGIINAHQHDDYEDIQMETKEITTPSYGNIN